MDLKDINWDGDSYNIIVESGDAGTINNLFVDGVWIVAEQE